MIDNPVRLGFWNVPIWGEIGVYVLGLLAVAVCIWGIVLNVRLWHAHRKEKRAEQSASRWKDVLLAAFGQKKIRETPMGRAHFYLAWGFFLLFCGTALATLDWDVGHYVFGNQFLKGTTYLVYKFILDMAGLAVLITLALGAWRRYRTGSTLPKDTRYTLGYAYLAFIIATGFAVEALRLATLQPAWSAYSPVGHALAQLLLATGITPEALKLTHTFVWVMHGVISLAFIAAIPVSVYAHMYRTPTHLYTVDKNPLIDIKKIEDIEEQETFGISKFSQFTAQDRLAFDACTECGRCNDACPAVRAGTPLKPRELLIKLRNRMHTEPSDKIDDGEVSEVISRDELWSCTTCDACARVCPANIPLPEMIVNMRRHLAMEEGAFPEGVATALENTASVGNPWGLDPYERLDWAKDLDVPVAEAGQEVDILYWVGCAASYDRRAQKVARAMVKLLKASGVSFAIMQEERCHGEFARRMGEEYLFQTAAQENLDNFAQYSFKRILTACPHCFNTLAREYPAFEGFNYSVISHTVWLNEMIQSGKLPRPSATLGSTAYHDPCYLARMNGIVDAPRNVLKSVSGDLRLPAETGTRTFCCGAGGGQMWSEGNVAKTVNVIRLKDLRATGASQVAVACPHCLTMLESAKSLDKSASETAIKDVAELVLEALESQSLLNDKTEEVAHG